MKVDRYFEIKITDKFTSTDYLWSNSTPPINFAISDTDGSDDPYRFIMTLTPKSLNSELEINADQVCESGLVFNPATSLDQ